MPNSSAFMKNYKKFLFLLLFLGVCFALFYFSQEQEKKQNKTLKIEALNLPPLEVGDLIFRRGDSLESLIISQISNHHYTHLGLIISTDPIIIIHATTDDNINRQNQVILSPLNEFISHANSLAIKRFLLTKAQKEAIVLAAKSQLGREFILSNESNAFYCTTLIESLLTPHITLRLNYKEVNLPPLSGKYFFPKEFFNAPQATLIYEKRI